MRMRAPFLIEHCYSSKNEFKELLWFLELVTKNPRGEILVSMVKPSTLVDRGEKIIQTFSLLFICDRVCIWW